MAATSTGRTIKASLIDTSFAQTKKQREARILKRRRAQAEAQRLVDKRRREANARTRLAAPVHKVRGSKKTKVAKRTRVDEVVDAQTEGFRTPAEQRAAKKRKN